MSAIRISLTDPQYAFVTAEDQFPALVAGFGAGKTHAAIARAIARKLQYPRQNVAYYLPTYDLVRTMGFPRFEEMLGDIGLAYKANRQDAFIEMGSFGRIIFRTMDTPERIVAYEVADSLVDELDTLPIEKARTVWNKIIGRNRQKKPDGSLNTVAVATTPEGFRFVYDRWKKNPAPGYLIISASTESNAKNLPDGYIQSLRDSYTPALLQAYLDGMFVNLASGNVYPEFDRLRHHAKLTPEPGEPIHIGMDFNVTKMAAVVHLVRDGQPHAVREHTGIYDTPAMIEVIRSAWPDRRVLVYPDSSGSGRHSSNASISDIALLRGAGFQVCAHSSNPAIKDRVAAVNKLLRDDWMTVDTDACPVLTEALEQQAYDKNGNPDKAAGLDHVTDACGYFCAYKYPVRRPAAVVTSKLTGFY